MSNYSKTTDFEAKDSLPTGDSGKIIRGAEFETEFDAISTAIATKADTAGPTFTGTLTFETISDGTIGVTAFVDEDDMSSDSATLVPTQQSVKAYVDSQVTAQDLDFQADTGGALSIDLDSETLTFTGGTGIDTSGSGNAVTFAIDSTVATLTGTQTLTNKTLTSPDVNTPDIDGGTIDGTVIGGTTPAAVSATTVSATGNITVGGTVDGRDVATDGTKLDGIEAGATADQTAAEIRTLVESATDSNVFTDADHTKLDGIEAGATGDQTDAEIRAAVEAATDSNVFTDADHSKLDGIEAGADVTDTANVTAAGALMDSEVTNLAQVKAFDSADYATAAQGSTADSALQNVVEDTTPQLGGNLDLNSNNITGTGNIDVTGTVTADGAEIDVTRSDTAGSGFLTLDLAGTAGDFAHRVDTANAYYLDYYTGSTWRPTIKIEGQTGDISFYEDTGTTAKLTWDSSAETLIVQGSDAGTAGIFVESSTAGVGARLDTIDATISNTASLTNSLLLDSDNHAIIRMDSNNNGSGDFYITESTSDTARLRIANNGDVSLFEDTGTTAKFYWDASAESLGIGTSSPSSALHVSDAVTHAASTEVALIQNTTTGQPVALAFQAVADNGGSGNEGAIYFDAGADGTVTNNQLQFTADHQSNTTPDMVITGAGNVGIGCSPSTTLEIASGSGNTDGATNSPTLRITNQTDSADWDVGDVVGTLEFYADDPSGNAPYDASFIKSVNEQDNGTLPSGALTFGTAAYNAVGGAVERMRIDSSGRVGIGEDNPVEELHISGSVPKIQIQDSDGTNQYGQFYHSAGITAIQARNGNADGIIAFQKYDGTTTDESARIDSSGNLLVGKTTTSNATAGAELNASGQIVGTFASGTHILGRNTNNGSILEFQKDGSPVGSIGVDSGDNLYISASAASHAGLYFSDVGISPLQAGSLVDAAVDLGSSTYRFQDLFLSGGVIFGSTGGSVTSKTLDDYEEGTWSPIIDRETTSPSVTYGTQTGRYTKIGRFVHATFLIQITGVTTAGSGRTKIGGLPFTSVATEASGASFYRVDGINVTATGQFTSQLTGGTAFRIVDLESDGGVTLIEAAPANGYLIGQVLFEAS